MVHHCIPHYFVFSHLQVYNKEFTDKLVSDFKNINLSDYTGFIKQTKKRTPKKCIDCGKEVCKDKKVMRCVRCGHLKQRKVVRPSYEQLLKDRAELKSNVQIGKKYSVTDNAIKKWFITYEKEMNIENVQSK